MLRQKEIAGGGANHTADDVRELGYLLICAQNGVEHLAAEIEDGYNDQSQWNLSAAAAGNRGKQDKRKDDSAGAEHSILRKQKQVQNPGGQRGAENDQKQAAASVFFFEHRPGEQQEHDIAAVVLPARMAEHMGAVSEGAAGSPPF